MKRPLAYITAAWSGDPCEATEQAAKYCRAVYEAGFSPICPMLYQPLFLNDAVPEEHKSGTRMGQRDRKSAYLHHETPFSRYGAFRGCDKAERRRHSACPHHHLWLTLPEPLTDRQQGRSCRGKIQSVLSCDPYYP